MRLQMMQFHIDRVYILICTTLLIPNLTPLEFLSRNGPHRLQVHSGSIWREFAQGLIKPDTL